jgi:serine protease AprX
MRTRAAGIVGLLATILCGFVSAADGAPERPKLDSALRTSTAASGLHIIVQTRSGALDTVANDARKRGNQIHRVHRLINAATMTVTSAQLKALEADGSVLTISVDGQVRASDDPGPFLTDTSSSSADASADAPAGTLQATGANAPASGAATPTRSVGVAVIDSGLEPTWDLIPYYFKDFVNGKAKPYDDYGHGTHVAGLIGGLGLMSNGRYRGVAPGVRLISLKALDGQGSARTSTIIQAIEFAVANRDALGIDVINLSLGHPVYEPPTTDPLVQAVNAAVRAGIVVIASAGNVGKNPDTGNAWYGGILSPGNSPAVITVGSVDTNGSPTLADDTIPLYSSRGPARFTNVPKPDLAAPGQNLVATAALHGSMYAKHPERQVPGKDGVKRYFRLSGTSMAAAVTSGTVALMITENRHKFSTRLTPNTVKALLEFAAIPLVGPDAVTQGRGELNAVGAVTLASAIDPAQAQGAWWLTSPIDTFTTLGNETHSWSQSVQWGTKVVWGNTVFINQPAWATDVVWGAGDDDTVVWGNSTGDDDTVVWGNNDEDTVVWGNSDDDDTVVWGNDDTVVWGNSDEDDDTVVWGNSLP